MTSNDPSPLDFATFDELANEIRRRCKIMFLVAVPEASTTEFLYAVIKKGGNLAVMGLADLGKRVCETELDSSTAPLPQEDFDEDL